MANNNGIINIGKNETVIDLGKKLNLRHIRVALGWDENNLGFGDDFDLDAVLFMLAQDGTLKQSHDLVFYNNRIRLEGSKPYDGPDYMVDEEAKKGEYAVYHTGDNRTGAGEGDAEHINVDLRKIPDYIHQLAVAITIHEADERRQTFGMVDNAYVRIDNIDTEQATIEYRLNEKYADSTAVIVGTFVRSGYDWDFKANSEGLKNGLAGLVERFGMKAKK